MASPRMQRWSLTLSAYDYEIQYRPGIEHQNADALSRLPLPEKPESVPKPGEVIFMIEHFKETTTTANDIKRHTRTDSTLSKVLQCVQSGWSHRPNETTMLPYYYRRSELSLEDGVVLWGNRACIPHKLHKAVLDQLHETHPGIVKMKSLARSYLWFPNLDQAIESCVKECHICQALRSAPPEAPLHPCAYPKTSWEI